jgi:hypothetical protein
MVSSIAPLHTCGAGISELFRNCYHNRIKVSKVIACTLGIFSGGVVAALGGIGICYGAYKIDELAKDHQDFPKIALYLTSLAVWCLGLLCTGLSLGAMGISPIVAYRRCNN